jgi:putative nucleotidyltransferase with HDIG domain
MFDACGQGFAEPMTKYFQHLAALADEDGAPCEAAPSLGGAVDAIAEMFHLREAVLMAADAPGGRFRPAAVHSTTIASPLPMRIPAPIEKDLIRDLGLQSVGSLPPASVRFLVAHVGLWLVRGDAWFLPLMREGVLVGLFFFGRRERPLARAESDMLAGLCRNLSIYIRRRLMHDPRRARQCDGPICDRAKHVYTQTVTALLTAIHMKDGYTKEHSRRVAEMAAVVAREIGFGEHEIEGIYFAGLLHDIGKILVDKEVLNKPGSLDLTEYAEMSRHTQLGAEIVSHIRFPWKNIIHAILHHHDDADPGGCRPDEPRSCFLGTRIIRLIDAFDAMTTNRPYRRALTVGESVREIVSCTNGQFDPEVTLAFLKVLQRDLHAPLERRRILTPALRNGDALRLFRQLAAAREQVEQMLGAPAELEAVGSAG